MTATAQLVAGYKPFTDGTTVLEMKAKFGRIILTFGDEAYRDQLIAAGVPAASIPVYFRGDALLLPQEVNPPLHNNLADTAGVVEGLLISHPDWFLRDANGDPITDKDQPGYLGYIMDWGVTGWQNYFIEGLRSRYLTHGWKGGVYLDNIEMSLAKRKRGSVSSGVPAKYLSDSTYFDAVTLFLKAIYYRWQRIDKPSVMVNAIEAGSATNLTRFAAIGTWTSGFLLENFATDYNDAWLSQAVWEGHLSRITQALGQKRTVFLYSQGLAATAARQQFALASYLLVSLQNKTFWRYVDSRVGYRTDADKHANLAYNLGAPLKGRYRVDSTTSWRRDFTRGTVIVNPTAHTSSISVR